MNATRDLHISKTKISFATCLDVVRSNWRKEYQSVKRKVKWIFLDLSDYITSSVPRDRYILRFSEVWKEMHTYMIFTSRNQQVWFWHAVIYFVVSTSVLITTVWYYYIQRAHHMNSSFTAVKHVSRISTAFTAILAFGCGQCVCHGFIDKSHDDVIKWKHFPRYWPFVRGIHQSPVNSPHKGQWRGALMFPLICVWTNTWANNGDAGDLRRYRAHHYVIVMNIDPINRHCLGQWWRVFPIWVYSMITDDPKWGLIFIRIGWKHLIDFTFTVPVYICMCISYDTFCTLSNNGKQSCITQIMYEYPTFTYQWKGVISKTVKPYFFNLRQHLFIETI